MNNYNYKITYKNTNADGHINYVLEIHKLDSIADEVMIYHTPFFESEKSEEELAEIINSLCENNWESKNLIDSKLLEIFNTLNSNIELTTPNVEFDQYGHPISNIGE